MAEFVRKEIWPLEIAAQLIERWRRWHQARRAAMAANRSAARSVLRFMDLKIRRKDMK